MDPRGYHSMILAVGTRRIGTGRDAQPAAVAQGDDAVADGEVSPADADRVVADAALFGERSCLRTGRTSSISRQVGHLAFEVPLCVILQ
jgi:hypothetical protein